MDAYIFQADIYCEDCAAHLKLDRREYEGAEDSDAYPQGPYGEGGGEADTPQHCGGCGTFLDNPLTGDGETYVRDAFSEYVDIGRGDPETLIDWRWAYEWVWDDFESITLPDRLEEQGGWKPGQEERFKRLLTACT